MQNLRKTLVHAHGFCVCVCVSNHVFASAYADHAYTIDFTENNISTHRLDINSSLSERCTSARETKYTFQMQYQGLLFQLLATVTKC